MSFASRLGALTRELVQTLVPSSIQGDESKINKISDASLKRLKSHTFLQTNHFEVEKTLEGLDERFRVNNRDDLADALRQRLVTLKGTPSKWHPEILHLLLELSDQPTFKSKLDDLELLGYDDVEPTTALRWEDIAKEDGWDQDDLLWMDVNYSDESGDEVFEQQSTTESEATSLYGDGDHAARTAETYVTHPQDSTTFEQVQTAQKWRTQAQPDDPSRHARKVAVSEIQVVRDVLFMLQGLDCTLFSRNCVADLSFQLENMAWETYRAIMQSFTDFGNHLRTLRLFVGQRQDVPHLQAFQDCISDRLRQLDVNISELQTRLAAPSSEYVLSLVRIKAELIPWLEPLYALADIVSTIGSEPDPTPFRYLELVFDETCAAQLSGKSELYEFLARIFAECFRVYLRPIRLWMDEGKLLSASDLFFVAEVPTATPLGKTWQEGYHLRRTPDGTLHAPAFLRTAIGNIYNAGKNIIVLKLLGKHDAAVSQKARPEPPLDYATICPAGQELVPFAELFDLAFDRWIQSKYRTTSTTLKNALFNDWALSSTLDTLHSIYLMSDGASSTLSDSIFTKLDALQTNWSDRYALTAAAQDSFTTMDPSRLTMTVAPNMHNLPAVQCRNSVRSILSGITITYRLPWALQMIFTDTSMQHYQSIFTLLLQLKRATYTLHKPKILDNYWTDHDNWNASAVFYASRSKLLWFCTTLQTYLTTLVLTPIDIQLRRDLASSHDMDELISVHQRATKAMIDQACLGSRLTPILDTILDTLDLSLKLERIRTGAIQPDESTDTSYQDMLISLKADIDSQIRFIYSGLRGLARATSDAQSTKWDILADMLQTGDIT
ncbi:gamma-tubulin complex component GCP5 [Pochonia chlamydosporia 170]|uniref:Spindle pole body component n=1 Tax=Pochonia chlamydosporia 170 TaxID=1380566 RepID=A0A179FDL7_METCM|nr:gamma-tubulin complex component GCP5 [Pochonia chlamydosporia 170]OAQ63448.1 gamma-tubulin complex component GCP5 [Pochonia chlamydosporia 170]